MAPQTLLTLGEVAARIRSGELSSVDLTKSVFARADLLDSSLGTYLTRFEDEALAAAEQADERLRSGGELGPLHGVPIGIKDVIATREGPTSAGSVVSDPLWGAGRDAPVVSRLRRAGAIITGKVTTSEFALGRPDPTKPFPIPRNPWDLTRWSGGSSAGSGNGVAAGLFLAALGTDTGGSVRGPAAACGVSGLIATFGRVSKAGVVPLAYSLDRVGAIARSAEDCATVLGVIGGYDSSDPSSVDCSMPDLIPPISLDLTGVRIGVDYVYRAHQDADPAIESCFTKAIAAFANLGATVDELSLPYYREVCTATWVILASEALAVYGEDLRTRWDDFYSTTRSRIAQGAFISGADYVQAQRVRTVAKRELARVFDKVDIVLTPTTGFAALKYDETGYVSDPDNKMSRLYFTIYWSGVGNPVLALPMGFNEERLPLSLQIAGRPFDEQLVLRVGRVYQQLTDWHLQIPPTVAQVP